MNEKELTQVIMDIRDFLKSIAENMDRREQAEIMDRLDEAGIGEIMPKPEEEREIWDDPERKPDFMGDDGE